MSPSLRTTVSRCAYLPIHQTLKRAKRRGSPSRVATSRFENLLEKHSKGEPTVFVHVGLRDIKAAFDTNPYTFLVDRLDGCFENIVTPGFTDYFKTSGVYHVDYSRPKHGTFGRLFLEDADYRTKDAIKSFLVRGSYRFDDCIHTNSYHPDGCFVKLVEDDVLMMNVGVPWITCSHFHYLEYVHDVDYMKQATYKGVIYENEQDHREITQTCSRYTSKYYSWNKTKIQRKLTAEGVLQSYDLDGLWLSFFSLKDALSVIGDEMKKTSIIWSRYSD